MKSQGSQIKGTLLLLLAAMIWGGAFVAQTVGMTFVGPFTFQAIRQLLGALVLLPVIFIRGRKGEAPRTNAQTKRLVGAGALCGLILFCACSLQQLGLSMQLAAGKSGFLTALYIVLVPLCGIFFRKKPTAATLAAVAIALCGLYFLCIQGSLSIGKAELLTIGCAVCFTAHILFLDYIAPQVDGLRLAALQFFFCGLFSIPFMLAESPVPAAIIQCWQPICYTGILSCGVGYTLQILAQRQTDPTLASIAMSMESVFSVLFGWLLLNQALSARELAGCVLMFAAILLAQLPAGTVQKLLQKRKSSSI